MRRGSAGQTKPVPGQWVPNGLSVPAERSCSGSSREKHFRGKRDLAWTHPIRLKMCQTREQGPFGFFWFVFGNLGFFLEGVVYLFVGRVWFFFLFFFFNLVFLGFVFFCFCLWFWGIFFPSVFQWGDSQRKVGRRKMCCLHLLILPREQLKQHSPNHSTFPFLTSAQLFPFSFLRVTPLGPALVSYLNSKLILQLPPGEFSISVAATGGFCTPQTWV